MQGQLHWRCRSHLLQRSCNASLLSKETDARANKCPARNKRPRHHQRVQQTRAFQLSLYHCHCWTWLIGPRPACTSLCSHRRSPMHHANQLARSGGIFDLCSLIRRPMLDQYLHDQAMVKTEHFYNKMGCARHKVGLAGRLHHIWTMVANQKL